MARSFLPPPKPRPSRSARLVAARERVTSARVRGSGRLELFDANSGRKVDERTFENFIATPGLERIQWMTRHAIGLGYGQETNDFEVGAGGSGYPEFWDLAADDVWEGEAPDVFSHFVLNNDTAAEDEATEYAPKLHTAPVIGWANRDAYAGADTKRGSINFAEVRRNASRIILVFDWPTSAGNGTFRSLQFCRIGETSLVGTLDSVNGPNVTLALANDNGGAVDDGTGDGVWVTDRTNTTAGNPSIRRCSYDDGSVLDSITYSALGSMRPAGIGLDIVSGDLWVEQYNLQGDSIKRVTTGGAVVTTLTIPSPMDTSHYGLAYGDGKLFLGAIVGSTYRVAQLDQTTGAVIDNVDLDTSETSYQDIGGLSYNEATGTLFARTSNADSTVLWELDPDTLDVVNRYVGPLSADNVYFIWRSGSSLLAKLGHYLTATGDALAYFTGPGTLGSRVLLDAEVEKSSLQTMKITYQFDFA